MEQILPHVYLDGAHNKEAVLAWRRTLDVLFPDRKKRLLFAVANDKDYRDMICCICHGIHYEKIYITRFAGARGTEAGLVEQQFKEFTEDRMELCEDTKAAFLKACRERLEDEDLFLVGSLYLAGAVKGYLEVLS